MKIKKIELSIPVDEKSLLQFLLDRYGDQVYEAGIFLEGSIIRDFSIMPDGKCVFRVCALTLLEEPKPSALETCNPCQNALSSIRIRKSKKISNLSHTDDVIIPDANKAGS